jgi:hypothetical protein
MRKITVSDFSGGIQEATAPDDFSDRQWAQLKGVVSASETSFETQWAIQTIGSASTDFVSVFPLSSSVGTFLVGIKTDGTLWWTLVPEATADYDETNDSVWVQITTASNVGWAAGNSTTQPSLAVQRNPAYRFLCAVPLEVQKYVRTPDNADRDNTTKDIDNTSVAKGLASGVLINTTGGLSFGRVDTVSRSSNVATVTTLSAHPFVQGDQIITANLPSGFNGSYTITAVTTNSYSFASVGSNVSPTTAPAGSAAIRSQALVAYVDTNPVTIVRNPPRGNYSSPGSVKVALFPNVRRLPTHSEEGDFIRASHLSATDVELSSQMPEWPLDVSPSVYMHPYTYVDKNGTLLPGSGIIPRARVGTVKGSTLILGDIQWRTKYGKAAEVKESVNCVNDAGSVEFGVFSSKVNPPTEVPSYARVLYNDGPGVVYLSDGSGLTIEIVSKAASAGVATLITAAPHTFSATDKVEIFNVEGRFDGVYTLQAGTDGATSTLVYNISSTDSVSTTKLVSKVSAKSISGTTATIKTSVAHGLSASDLVQISNAGFPWDQLSATVVATPDATTFTYTLAAAPGDVAELSVTTDPSAYPRGTKFKYRVEVGAYQTIPDSWAAIYGAASASKTKIKAARNLNIASHQLNDANTGPFRGGIYFSAGELDTFDPRAVLLPAKTDVRIAGLHMLDDTLIIITQKGSAEDGVLRLRGYLSRLISYGGTSDPNAVRIELIRGGIGAPRSTSGLDHSSSCVWTEAGVVVFIDAAGGVYYTNGQACDRLDRYGPKPPLPSSVTSRDHVASLGRNLLVYRHNGGSSPRLLCFTIMGSDGASGTGCWTELNIPGAIRNMVGTEDAAYWVYDGKVQRLNPSAPIAERGRIDNAPTTITVGTRSFGDVGSHRRTTWHRFGMTFDTPTSCTVQDVKIQSTGVLNAQGTVSAPDVQYSVTLNRTFSDPGILGEFIVPAGIGPQAVASATVTFQGYVRLQSASFWASGDDPRSGDK